MARRWIASLTSTALLFGTVPVPFPPVLMAPAHAQDRGPVQVQIYGMEQLDAILAPIALYPDPLLSQVLMAVAYPDQLAAALPVAEDAARRGLRGAAVEQAVVQMAWDPSVKSLVPFPRVLTLLTAHQDWAQQLAYAMAVQQPDVLDSVQRLRLAAWRSGHLRSLRELRARMEGNLIYIEPAEPSLIYVPVYNPTVVYGGWAYPSYPPVYYPPPPNYVPDSILAGGIGFAVGVAVAATLWDISRPRWRERDIWVDTTRYNHINPQHPPMREQRWIPPTEHWREGASFRQPPRGAIGEPMRPARIVQPGAPAVALPSEPGHGPGGTPPREVTPGTGAMPGGQPTPALPGRIAPREGQQVTPPPSGGPGAVPAEPGRRATPAVPAERVAPTAPAEHVAPGMPPGRTTPAVPAERVAPAAPAEHVAPAMPSGRTTPAVPAERVAPAVPAEHVAPGTPPGRATPAVPAERATPAMPPGAHPGAGTAPVVPPAAPSQMPRPGGAPPMRMPQERQGQGGPGGGVQPHMGPPPGHVAPPAEASPSAPSARPEGNRPRPEQGQDQRPAGNERR